MLWFEAISGLKINLEKSLILAVGNVENLDDQASELGCRTGALPSTYLGLPLSMRRNSLEVWDGVEERFKKKLALWKRQYISKGGKVNPHQEHSFNYADLHYVFVPDSIEG